MVTRNSASAIPAAHRTPLAMSAGIRYVGVLSGRYVVVPTDGAEGGPTVAFACRTTSLSPNLDHAGQRDRGWGRGSSSGRRKPPLDLPQHHPSEQQRTDRRELRHNECPPTSRAEFYELRG